MARLGTILMAVAVALVALLKLGLIAQLVAVAFSLAGCTIFPLFLLGIWWSGSNRAGAWAGLIAGSSISVIALVYFIANKFGAVLPGNEFITYYLNPWYFAIFGAPIALFANIIVSKFSKEETPIEIKKFLAKQVHNYKVEED